MALGSQSEKPGKVKGGPLQLPQDPTSVLHQEKRNNKICLPPTSRTWRKELTFNESLLSVKHFTGCILFNLHTL